MAGFDPTTYGRIYPDHRGPASPTNSRDIEIEWFSSMPTKEIPGDSVLLIGIHTVKNAQLVRTNSIPRAACSNRLRPDTHRCLSLRKSKTNFSSASKSSLKMGIKVIGVFLTSLRIAALLDGQPLYYPAPGMSDAAENIGNPLLAGQPLALAHSPRFGSLYGVTPFFMIKLPNFLNSPVMTIA